MVRKPPTYFLIASSGSMIPVSQAGTTVAIISSGKMPTTISSSILEDSTYIGMGKSGYTLPILRIEHSLVLPYTLKHRLLPSPPPVRGLMSEAIMTIMYS